MTRRDKTSRSLLFSIPLLAGWLASPILNTALAQRPPWLSPSASVRVRFQPPAHEAWTVRTVRDHTLTLELSSTGRSRTTTLTARRVMLAREEIRRVRRGIERTTTLRSVQALRNGLAEARPAEAGLAGRPLGVRLSSAGRVTGTIGLSDARDAVTARSQEAVPPDDPTGGLVDAAPEEEALRAAWDADAGRYLGRSFARGEVLRAAEELRLPFLRGKPLPYVSEEKVQGPVVVAGRPGLALDVKLYSLEPSQLATGTELAAWARKNHARAGLEGSRVAGSGRRVIALDGRGVLEESLKIDVALTGALAAEAGNSGPPSGRVEQTTKGVRMALAQSRSLLSTPTAIEPVRGAGRERSERVPARSRKAPPAEPEEP